MGGHMIYTLQHYKVDLTLGMSHEKHAIIDKMNAKEYEQYVTKLVKGLDFFKSGTIYTNKRFPGVRQPGEYEIDVAVEMSLGDVASFLLIIECKNWKRPVDRPVIQKLAQTRDAIAAQKAAVVSPVGFSNEAVEVAKVHGIALWVIAEGTWSCIMGMMGPPPWKWEYESLRLGLLESLGITPPEISMEHFISTIVKFSAISSMPEGDAPWRKRKCSYGCVTGSAVTDHASTPGVDNQTALSQIANDMFLHVKQNFNLDDSGIVHAVKTWLLHAEQHIIGLGLSQEKGVAAVQAVVANDSNAFHIATGHILSRRHWI